VSTVLQLAAVNDLMILYCFIRHCSDCIDCSHWFLYNIVSPLMTGKLMSYRRQQMSYQKKPTARYCIGVFYFLSMSVCMSVCLSVFVCLAMPLTQLLIVVINECVSVVVVVVVVVVVL